MQEKGYQVGKGASISILVVLSLLQLVDWADRSILSIALPSIKAQFSLTDAQAGMLPALLQFGIAIFTVPAAMFADRLARRKVIMVMDIVWSTFTLVTGFATQLWHLLVARFMVGAGEAGYAPAGQAWLGVAFPKNIRSRVFGVFTAFNPIGVAVGLFVGGILISTTHNWQVPFYVFGIPGFILAAIVIFLPDYKIARQQGEGLFSKAYFKDWGTIFKIKSFWFITASMIFLYFSVFALTSWAPTLVLRAYKMDTAGVGMTLGLIGLLYIVGPFGGFIADKWWLRNKNGRPLFVAICSFLFVAIAVPTWLNAGSLPFAWWIALYAIISVLIAISQPVSQTLIHDVTPVGVRSTSFGTMLLFAQLLGGTLGPIFVGAVSDKLGGGIQGLQIGLVWSSLLPVLGVISLLLLTKYYPADNAKIDDAVLAEK
jgi:MFS transporter, Spinster family, sphingosine-1-phosphate transporter